MDYSKAVGDSIARCNGDVAGYTTTTNKSYNCFTISTASTTNITGNSVLDSGLSFVEVTAEIKDFFDNSIIKSTNCADVNTAIKPGVVLIYLTHMYHGNEKLRNFSSKGEVVIRTWPN